MTFNNVTAYSRRHWLLISFFATARFIHSWTVFRPFRCFHILFWCYKHRYFAILLSRSFQTCWGLSVDRTLSAIYGHVWLGLYLGHSGTFSVAPNPVVCCLGCVLRFIVLLEGKSSARSEVLSTLDPSLPVLPAENHPHNLFLMLPFWKPFPSTHRNSAARWTFSSCSHPLWRTLPN